MFLPSRRAVAASPREGGGRGAGRGEPAMNRAILRECSANSGTVNTSGSLPYTSTPLFSTPSSSISATLTPLPSVYPISSCTDADAWLRFVMMATSQSDSSISCLILSLIRRSYRCVFSAR